MRPVTIRKLTHDELALLLRLHDYNDPADMLRRNGELLRAGKADFFVLFEGERPIGELRAAYEADDERAVRGTRAYLYAFRVLEQYRGRGCGTALMLHVLAALEAEGYREFTIGVEDDNEGAKRMYARFGFTELLCRKYEEYQGDGYEFGLYIMRRKNNTTTEQNEIP